MNLYLIDGNSYVYRAFFAIKDLTNSKGFPTNAIYGFTNMLLKIIRERRPDGIVVSFDSPVPTERHLLYDAYKAHRPETPGDLARQLPHIRKLIAAFRIKIFELPGYEADDLLATIATKAAADDADVFIVTADKDMLQVVGDRVKIYDPVKDRVLDREYVREKFGVGPDRVSEFMALTGDAVDNIPGIKGIGEKTAKELLSSFSSIDDLLSHPERIEREKLRNLVADNAEAARLSLRLALINTSVPVDVNIGEYAVQEPDWPALLTLFREYEFGSLMKLIPTVRREHEYERVFSSGRLREIAASVRDSFALDTEATGRNPRSDRIVGISLCTDNKRAYYIPFGHVYPGAPEQVDKKEGLDLLAGLFGDKKIPKIGHNLKYDLSMLRREGIDVNGKLYDTMLASYLLNPNRSDHSLGDVVFTHLSYRKKTFQEVLGKRGSFSEISVEDATAYAAEDAALAFELKDSLFERIDEEGMSKLYFDIEMPLITVLMEIEEAGFKIDRDKFHDMSKELTRELDAITTRIFFLAGEDFNINSPKQLSRILFQTLGLKPGKKTKTGFSTEVGVLEELAAEHELPREILDYRSLSKLKSTYTDVLPELINPETRRIHTSFNQTVTATGRLSSSDPNLQNIPIRGEWGRRMREAFIAEEGNLIISADYSQIELRILAHLSGDRGLIEAFMSGIDVHSKTASELFGVPIGKVTSDMRRVAKTVNFGIVYGISPFGLSEALSISREDAKRYIDGYFAGHPGVKTYIGRALLDAGEKGFVTTMFGRKRTVPELKSRTAATRSMGERLAVNSPIQGTAADIIKIAMIGIRNLLRTEGSKTKMVLQVHDELVFESPEEETVKAKELIRAMMEGAADIRVPLKVEIGHGRNWAEAHG
ncbi:MAG TPA: DNA polymerase I [Thermodesulfovibrionales bacterium]|nr:DNA polymerase I [Thermodesulfovibrionales bacterium]